MFWFVIAPYFVGRLLTEKINRDKNSSLLAILSGYMGMLVLFEIMGLPMIFARLSFGLLKYSYSMVIMTLVVVSVFRNHKGLFAGIKGEIKQGKNMSWTGILALILIAVQLSFYVLGMATDLDDALYVATAVSTIETDTMMQYSSYSGKLLPAISSRYILSPFPIMLAFFAWAVQIHPTIVAHTIMPVFFVSLAYGVYALLGQKLLKKDIKATGMFLCFLSLIHMFSYYSVYTQGTFMLIRIWQGKAFLAAVILPFVFYLGRRVFEEEAMLGDWLTLLCAMGAACLVSSMGIMLAPIMLGVITILLGIAKKQWRKTSYAILCCFPNIVCGIVYLFIR